MIARIWRGQAPPENADAYHRHATRHVFPALARLDGHRGAWLLRREVDGGIEFLVMTLWDSVDAIRVFAGDSIATAVVEPEARAVLSDFDAVARHYEVAHIFVSDREVT
jgi:heme-degrading monooxygenase HmoA